MVTKPGVKLLDFGLAKLLADTTVSYSSDAPTQARQKDLTAEQAVVGTLQYMAPEQLEGKAADARTDIFAFGVMLYEMITGRKAFEGKSQASLITAIMSAEPPSTTRDRHRSSHRAGQRGASARRVPTRAVLRIRLLHQGASGPDRYHRQQSKKCHTHPRDRSGTRYVHHRGSTLASGCCHPKRSASESLGQYRIAKGSCSRRWS